MGQATHNKIVSFIWGIGTYIFSAGDRVRVITDAAGRTRVAH